MNKFNFRFSDLFIVVLLLVFAVFCGTGIYVNCQKIEINNKLMSEINRQYTFKPINKITLDDLKNKEV